MTTKAVEELRAAYAGCLEVAWAGLDEKATATDIIRKCAAVCREISDTELKRARKAYDNGRHGKVEIHNNRYMGAGECHTAILSSLGPPKEQT